MKTLLDNEYFSIELENGIIISTWKSTLVDLTIAKKMLVSRLEILKGQQYPFLIKINSLKDLTKEARDFFASEQGCEGVIAGAIYVNSVLENYIAAFFIMVNRPMRPTKIFNDEIKAKKWLAQYVTKDQNFSIEKNKA